MATAPTDHVEHDYHSPHKPKHTETEFVPTSLFEVIMYFIAVGVIVGVALVLNAGFEQAASMFQQLLGER
ncbi:MAG: hypothetical protein H6821_16720 [Planctomycetaceae bacterium]|nr:hypothetical protein [Planctomycetaceae bacterium]